MPDSNRNARKERARSRRIATLFVAFLYLFVGVAHNVFCADQVIAAQTISSQTMTSQTMAAQAVNTNIADDGDAKASVVLCDHCPTCVPAMTPSPAFAETPVARPSEPIVVAAMLIVDDHSRLDPRPPKHLV